VKGKFGKTNSTGINDDDFPATSGDDILKSFSEEN